MKYEESIVKGGVGLDGGKYVELRSESDTETFDSSELGGISTFSSKRDFGTKDV